MFNTWTFIIAIAIFLCLAFFIWSFWRKRTYARKSSPPKPNSKESLRPSDATSEKGNRETPILISDITISSQVEDQPEEPRDQQDQDLKTEKEETEKPPPPIAEAKSIVSKEPLDGDQTTPHQPTMKAPIAKSEEASIEPGLESPTVPVDPANHVQQGGMDASSGKSPALEIDQADKEDLEPTSDEPQTLIPDQKKTAPNGNDKSQQILAESEQKIAPGAAEESTKDSLAPLVAETEPGESEHSEPTEPEDDLSSVAVEEPPKEDLGRKSPLDQKKVAEKRQPPKYQPTIRTPEATKRNRGKQHSETESIRERSLQMHVHVVLGRRNRCQVSLIPSRTPDLEEEIDVNGPNGKEFWSACQDEWYSDISPENISFLLEKGGTWEVREEDETKLRWILSIREIYVLAPSSTISAYVSTTRLILYEDHIVLCTERQVELVRKALAKAGCSEPMVISSENGVPEGWILFLSVCPTCSVEHDQAAGIFNILRPVHDLEIILQGGIRLTHNTWINGHPPKIRIRGSKDDNIQVMIDGEVASADADGMYTAEGLDSQGTHNVFCGGVTKTYEMNNGLQQWEHFEAYKYSPSLQTTAEKSVTICGPVVTAIDEIGEAALTPTINARLLGAIPGQITYFPRQDNTRTPEYLAIADFPIVWTLPTNPFQCDRYTSYVKLIRAQEVGSIQNFTDNRDKILRWSYAILDASRRHLRIEPDTDESKKIWIEYKQVARRLWKKMK